MRAIVVNAFESPDKLFVSEQPDPTPQEGEVLIEVKATGLGYVDALTVAGLYQIKPRCPFVPGSEISGVVRATGTKVKHLKMGDRILAMPGGGGLADLVCVQESRCLLIPDSLDHKAAAGFQVNYCTAFHGLEYCGDAKPGETVLVLGAAGGVGVAAIDVARAMGARVIAAASTAEKRKACLALGAEAAIDYSQENWRDELKAVLNNSSLDIVYDPVGGPYAEPALRSLSPDGRFLVVGFASGEIPKLPMNLPLLKRCRIVGVNWGAHSAAHPGESSRVMTTLLDWIKSGKLQPKAGGAYALEDSGTAMMDMLNRKAVGKIVIDMEQNQ